jgi:hypothetical protein
MSHHNSLKGEPGGVRKSRSARDIHRPYLDIGTASAYFRFGRHRAAHGPSQPADAPGRAAAAGQPPFVVGLPVIHGHFFTGFDVAQRIKLHAPVADA